MALALAKWFLRTGLQWICGALLALAITAVEQHYHFNLAPAYARPTSLEAARSR